MINLPTKMTRSEYDIESFKIFLSSQTDPIVIDKNNINEIYIEKDYESDHFPIIYINFNTNPELYYKIVEDKLNVKFHLRLQMIHKNENLDYNYKEDIINDIFCTYSDISTPFLNKDLFESRKETENSDVVMNNMYERTVIYLYKESDMNNSKKIFNTVISEANLTDIITYCLYNSGIKNVLMSPLTNKNKYKEVLLPPITTLSTLKYLEQQYDGFYNNPALIFFDIDAVYIIDSGLESKVYRKQEPEQTIFTVRNVIDADSASSGSVLLTEEKKYVINVNHDALAITSITVKSDQIEGNNYIIINPNTGKTSVIKSDTVQRGDGTYRILVNKFNNNKIQDFLIKRKKEEGCIISLNLKDVDLKALTPNKEFLFVFEDQKVNKEFGGKYRLVKSVNIFIKDGEEFKVSSNCNFKKIK